MGRGVRGLVAFLSVFLCWWSGYLFLEQARNLRGCGYLFRGVLGFIHMCNCR